MAIVEVSGSSDDLVHVSGVPGGDEFNLPGDNSWSGLLEAPNGERAMLFVDYRNNGTWTATLGLAEEDAEFPEWSIDIVSGENINAYTTRTLIAVPEGTVLWLPDSH